MQTVTARTLDGLVELDTVFTLTPDGVGSAVYRDALDYAPGTDLGHAPSVYIEAEEDEYGDIHVTADVPFIDGKNMTSGPQWEFYSRGYTGQYGVKKSDPVMHTSEYVGGKLARDMIKNGGKFVVTLVTAIGDFDNDDDIIGWVVLRMSDD